MKTPCFGSHLSIAGGYWKAALAAGELGMQCVQIFTKNNNQWAAKPLIAEDVERFTEALSQANLQMAVSHNSYLINLASPDESLWEKSIAAMIVEVERAAALGILQVVAHPGAHMGSGEEAGIDRIAAGLDRVLKATVSLRPAIALEITAGQGTCLGHRFEHLSEIIRRCRYPDRLTICLDTCHLFAAGYSLAPRRKYRETLRQFDRLIGIDRIKVWHLNDSKRELGSRVDRHEHIGHGKMGSEPFEHIVNDRRFVGLPLILETAKETNSDTGEDWDAVNLRHLQSLVRRRR